MIHILHPTVFSLTDSSQSPSCGRGLSLLKFPAKAFVLRSFLFDSFAAHKTGLMLAVVCCDNKVNATVNANDIANIRI